MAHNYPQQPHFAVPFRISVQGHGTPTALVTEQDTEEEIFDCVETVLRYETGYRIEKPEFGTPDQTFAEPIPDTSRIFEAIDTWEPRAEPIITAKPDEFDALISRVKVAI
jgi:phage baseplate assembly protein W